MFRLRGENRGKVLHRLKTRLWPVDEWRPLDLLAAFIRRSCG
jgi:hypothetical protein